MIFVGFVSGHVENLRGTRKSLTQKILKRKTEGMTGYFLLKKRYFLFVKVVIMDTVTIVAAFCHQCAQVCYVSKDV